MVEIFSIDVRTLSELTVGDETNYVEIKTNGEIVLHGDARIKKPCKVFTLRFIKQIK